MGKDMPGFLKRTESVLQSKPLWIFSSGPTGEGNPDELVQG